MTVQPGAGVFGNHHPFRAMRAQRLPVAAKAAAIALANKMAIIDPETNADTIRITTRAMVGRGLERVNLMRHPNPGEVTAN